MPNEELKPCPFCGGRAGLWQKEHYRESEYRVFCMKCHVTQAGQFYYSKNDAFDAWNRRVQK